MSDEMPTIQEVLETTQRYITAMQDNDHKKASEEWDKINGDEWLPLNVYLSAMSFVMAYESEQVGNDDV